MKRILFTMLLAASLSAEAQTQTYETEFARPLNEVLTDIQNRFGVRLKYDIDTVGKVLPYADFRIRPYSVEESLTNVLAPFDYKFVKQKGNMYKLKAYEYPRRTDADGEKMLAYLNTLYTDQQSFQLRADSLKKEVRQRLGIDTLLAQCVKTKPILSKIRKFDGYTVQNFALETLPGLYVCGSIYTPQSKGKHALIICPNGHFGGGRYREDPHRCIPRQEAPAPLSASGTGALTYSDLPSGAPVRRRIGAESFSVFPTVRMPPFRGRCGSAANRAPRENCPAELCSKRPSPPGPRVQSSSTRTVLPDSNGKACLFSSCDAPYLLADLFQQGPRCRKHQHPAGQCRTPRQRFSPRLLAERVGVIGQQDDARTPQQTGKGVAACPLFQFCQPGKHGLRRCADFPQHKDNGSH